MQPIKFSNKTYIISAIILIVIPIVVNELMSFHIVKVYGDTNAWVGFLGSYFGSIISGAITLIGVLLTLQHSEKESKKALDLAKKEARRNQLPIMITHAEEALDIIDGFLTKVHEFQRIDKSDFNKSSFERAFKLFKVDADFLLAKTTDYITINDEFNRNKKLIRNHMVQIDEHAYQCFRRFEVNSKEIYDSLIEPIEDDLLEFQGHIVTKYRETHDAIITNMELPLNTIRLDQEDLHLLDKILRKLLIAEKKYIDDLNNTHFELQDSLNMMLLRFSDEFSVK